MTAFIKSLVVQAQEFFAVDDDVLVVTNIYKEPKGASFTFNFGSFSLGKKSQRIEIDHSSHFRFAVQLLTNELRQEVNRGVYKNHPEWRVLKIQEGPKGGASRLLVSITSVAKRFGVSKERIIAASNAGQLEKCIADEYNLWKSSSSFLGCLKVS
jgi:hypothetical protein